MLLDVALVERLPAAELVDVMVLLCDEALVPDLDAGDGDVEVVLRISSTADVDGDAAEDVSATDVVEVVVRVVRNWVRELSLMGICEVAVVVDILDDACAAPENVFTANGCRSAPCASMSSACRSCRWTTAAWAVDRS